MQRLTLSDFATLANLTVLPDNMATDFLAKGIEYEYIKGQARDDLIREMLTTMDSGALSLAGTIDRWDLGWQENLDRYSEHGDEHDLIPRYLTRGGPLRIYGKYAHAVVRNRYIHSITPERALYEVYRAAVFHKWFSAPDTIYEFGSGSGYNLYALAKMFPEKRILGLDWSQPAVDIADLIGERTKAVVVGKRFDFFTPRGTMPYDAGVLTVGALEQTGDNYRGFIHWLIKQKPSIVVHIEPQPDWYYPDSLEDYLGIRYLQVRKYWSGFPAYMLGLQDEGKIEILDQWRTGFGSKWVEGYSRFVWRPT